MWASPCRSTWCTANGVQHNSSVHFRPVVVNKYLKTFEFGICTKSICIFTKGPDCGGGWSCFIELFFLLVCWHVVHLSPSVCETCVMPGTNHCEQITSFIPPLPTCAGPCATCASPCRRERGQIWLSW